MKFLRRIGANPHVRNLPTSATSGCPDIWELDTGDFAVIGIDATAALLPQLPDDASCGSDERIVLIDRHVLLNARRCIPTE